MKKLRLDLDTLDVQSFTTSADLPDVKGTIRAASGTAATDYACADATLIYSCDRTCECDVEATLIYSCDQTCDVCASREACL